MYLWVLEENHAATGFYENLGADIVTKDIYTNPDGTKSPVLCCFWKDLDIFFQDIT